MTQNELDELCKLTIDEFFELGYSINVYREVEEYVLEHWDSGKFLSEEYGVEPYNPEATKN